MPGHAQTTDRRSNQTSRTLALLLALGLVGCGTGGRVGDPTPARPGIGAAGPASRGTGGSNGFVTTLDSGTSSRDRSDDDDKQRPTTVPTPITNTVVTKEALIGRDGGKIKAGLFEIDVPEGALSSPVQISVSDYSGVTGRIECELLPHGLHFHRPVELAVKLPSSMKLDSFTLFCVVDEGLPTEFWSAMPTRVESGGGRIIAELTHFSRYAPGQTDGKAGWQKLPGRGGQSISLTGDDRRP